MDEYFNSGSVKQTGYTADLSWQLICYGPLKDGFMILFSRISYTHHSDLLSHRNFQPGANPDCEPLLQFQTVFMLFYKPNISILYAKNIKDVIFMLLPPPLTHTHKGLINMQMWRDGEVMGCHITVLYLSFSLIFFLFPFQPVVKFWTTALFLFGCCSEHTRSAMITCS